MCSFDLFAAGEIVSAVTVGGRIEVTVDQPSLRIGRVASVIPASRKGCTWLPHQSRGY
jgi:hypothetical protein